MTSMTYKGKKRKGKKTNNHGGFFSKDNSMIHKDMNSIPS